VFLKADYVLKVADFGLSRKAEDDGCYTQTRSIAVPIPYISPESLKSLRFSPESELWAFGVVLWELFTFAQKRPYALEVPERTSSRDAAILAFLEAGHRLPESKYAPESM
jgi:serine/threonine protein kinase